MRLFVFVYHERSIVIPTLDADKAHRLKETEGGGEVRRFDIDDRLVARQLPENLRGAGATREDRAMADLMDALLGKKQGR